MSEEVEKEAGGPKKSKKKLFLLLAIVLLVVGGAGAYFFLGSKEKKHEVEEVEEKHHFAVAELEPFYVNLAQSGSFLKVVIVLEVDVTIIEQALHLNEAGGEAHGDSGSGGGEGAASSTPALIKTNMPKIRDVIIRILSSKSGEEVLSTEGKNLLAEELVEGINSVLELEEGPVVKVLFVEFLVQ
jgi:flagellar FliL protein